jgi:hypothetical protein
MMDDLQTAISLVGAGKTTEAGRILSALTKTEPDNDLAWQWLSACVVPEAQKRYCLNQALRINPHNRDAQQWLARLDFAPVFEESPAGNSASEPSASQASSSEPVLAGNAPTPGSGESAGAPGSLDPISIIMIVLLVLLAGYWLLIGFLQFFVGAVAEQNTFDLAVCGAWNVFASILNLLIIGEIVKRSARVPNEMMLLAVFGTLWGGFQLILQGAALQACAIPFYIILGVLGYVNREIFVVGKAMPASKRP